jgi:hypothetical protein
MGELVLAEGEPEGKPWTVERRFRVTEVFLAVLWVRDLRVIIPCYRDNHWAGTM